MGREYPTVPATSNTMRRTERARRAKETVGQTIPDMLRGSPRARHGIHRADLVNDPPSNAPSGDITPSLGPRIRVQCCDTLEAASRVSERPAATKRTAPTLKTSQKSPNATILNFASALKPGGGFLEGANSQEEFICARTTLYASLWDDFYRLPELGGIHTPDVMVFRDCTPEANDLEKRDRFFVDVISAGMLRFPDVRGRPEERSEGGCTCGVSYCDRDRELVTRKMKAVMRIAQSKGTATLILGAWGCGAYGNPVKEVAKIWRKVIAGSPRQRRPNAERWEGIREIVFAIPDRRIARDFQEAFSGILAEDIPSPVFNPVEHKKQTTGTTHTDELISKINETEMQIEQANNPRRRIALREVLASLNRDLARGLAKALHQDDLTREEDEHDDDDEDAEYVVSDFAASDGEENSFYNFDENDVPSDSSDCAASEVYEFRPRSRRLRSNDPDDRLSGLEDDDFAVLGPAAHFDESTGWYSGSIDEFHALLKRTASLNGPGLGDHSHASRSQSPGPRGRARAVSGEGDGV